MFSPDGTLISASAAPHCGARNKKNKEEEDDDDEEGGGGVGVGGEDKDEEFDMLHVFSVTLTK